MNISNRFLFEFRQEKCWYFIDFVKVEVPKEFKSTGRFEHQIVFQLDPQNKSHWINYSITFSREKLWVKFWYKKAIADSFQSEGFRYQHYQKKIEKTSDLMEIRFTEADEMVKIWLEDKKKYKYLSREKV